MRRFLFRLQQRLSLTPYEGGAILLLLVLYLTGISLSHWRARAPPAGFDASATVPFPATLPPEATTLHEASPPIPINTATAAQLQRLPGIGPKTAARIIAMRQARGPFSGAEDLLRVHGIGPKTLERLAPQITFETPPP